MPHSGWPFRAQGDRALFQARAVARRGRPVRLRPRHQMDEIHRRAAHARRWRRLHELVPVQQDARQRPADAFRQALCRRSETHRAPLDLFSRQRHRPAAGARRGEPRSSRRRHAVRQPFHGQAEDHRAGDRRDGECAAAARLERRGGQRRGQRQRPGRPLLRRSSDPARLRDACCLRRQSGAVLFQRQRRFAARSCAQRFRRPRITSAHARCRARSPRWKTR